MYKSIRFMCIAITLATFPAVINAAAKPDIVVFLTDDHSQLDSTPYGNDFLKTPNMQSLADTGMTFDKAYVASPSCAPSRAAMLTGLMPARNGAEPNHAKPRPEIKKWPAYFQELGYEVVAYGKVSHYKHTVDYGFDSFAHDTFHDHESIPAAVKFLKQRDPDSTRPLCLMVGTNWPHVPWPKNAEGYKPRSIELPAASVDTASTRDAYAKYATAVTLADNDLGTIRKAVKETLGDDTIWLFSGDHGTQWPFGKWNCYEAGVRVPLIVSWPGVTKPGSRTSAMVSWVDFLPTLLEAVGGKVPENIDGKSFVSVLRGEKAEHRDKIYATHSGDGNWNVYPIRSVRIGDWKYIINLHPEYLYTTHISVAGELGRTKYWDTWEEAAKTDPRAAAIVNRYYHRPAEELYDLSKDPHEEKNLAADPTQASRLAEMRADVEAWMKSQGDQRKVYGKPRLPAESDAKTRLP